MKRFFSDNWIIMVIGVSFLTSTGLAIRNNYVIEKNHLLQQQSDLVRQRAQAILSTTMHGLDLGVRGYGLTLNDKLLTPYNEAVQTTSGIFRQLDSLLRVQDYPDRQELEKVKASVNEYIRFSNEMIDIARSNQPETFSAMLKEDRGYDVWATYSKFSTPLFAFENDLNHTALANYQTAMKSNLILQVILLVLAFPMLYIFVKKVKQERKGREQVLNEVETTDRSLVFDPGNTGSSDDVTRTSIANIKQASEFIGLIASGNYEAEWKGLTHENIDLNKQTLAGNLVNLKERLKQLKQEDDRRNWMNEGIATFTELVRNNQHDHDKLSLQCVSFLTKYIGAQQGSLFVLEGESNEKHLKLAACNAFERKKWIDQKIAIGSGLVGQAYLEGEPILLKEIPQGYTRITSGLGDATPGFLAIIPMKSNEQTLAIAEFATFREFGDHQIAFLQKAGEFLASAIASSQITAKMKDLLQEGSMREEQMRQREEELRQNMEELQSIQEEMERKQKEFTPAY